MLWMYPALIKTYCTLNVKYFPFDSQHCDIQFISWTHNGQQLDIFYNDTMNTAVYYASANQVGLATSFTRPFPPLCQGAEPFTWSEVHDVTVICGNSTISVSWGNTAQCGKLSGEDLSRYSTKN